MKRCVVGLVVAGGLMSGVLAGSANAAAVDAQDVAGSGSSQFMPGSSSGGCHDVDANCPSNPLSQLVNLIFGPTGSGTAVHPRAA